MYTAHRSKRGEYSILYSLLQLDLKMCCRANETKPLVRLVHGLRGSAMAVYTIFAICPLVASLPGRNVPSE